MKIVIQCAGTKNAQRPGSGFHASDGRLVKFVADPKDAPSSSQYAYVRPDDLSDGHHTWRERLLEYNKEANSNSLGLLPAYRLYARKVYEDLVGKFGTIVFIGGKDYLPLFCKLTKELTVKKKVFYNSSSAPALGSGFYTERVITTQKTNWHYTCAQELIDGSIKI